jgi:hypothetical protein
MPRFVLLEHRWNGIHWDLMLERAAGAPLRTWAIDEEIVPGRDLPARALGDHRAVYLEFEGALSGGRGTVRRMDEGEYTAIEWSDDRVQVELRGDQLAGCVALRRAVAGSGSPAWIFRLGNFD